VPSREDTLVAVDGGLKRELEAKVYSGERLTRADGVALYECDDLTWLGRLAHHVRTAKNGDREAHSPLRSYQETHPRVLG